MSAPEDEEYEVEVGRPVMPGSELRPHVDLTLYAPPGFMADQGEAVATSQTKESHMGTILAVVGGVASLVGVALFSPENLHALAILGIGAVVAVATITLVPWLKAKLTGLPASRLDLIFKLADMAFGVVEELANKTETDIDNKAVEGLKQLEELLRAANAPGLTAKETALVQARFDALHAASKAEAKA